MLDIVRGILLNNTGKNFNPSSYRSCQSKQIFKLWFIIKFNKKNLCMNRFKKATRKHNNDLGSILQSYMKDSFQSYTLKVRGSEIQLSDFSYKGLKSTYKASGQSKGQMNLFSNITSNFKHINSRQNKSPLRSRQQKINKNQTSSDLKTKQIIGIQKIQSKVRQRCKTTNELSSEPNFSLNKENLRMIDENRTVSDIIPKCIVEVSFQNLQQNFSCVEKMPSEIKERKKEQSFQIPKIAIYPPPQSHQQLKDNLVIQQPPQISENKPEEGLKKSSRLYTDSEIQKLRNPYASDQSNSIGKEIKKSCTSDNPRKDIAPYRLVSASEYKDIGIDDLDINDLIQIQQEPSNSPIKLIEHYLADFNLKDSIRPKPTTSHVYEAILMQ